MPFVCREPARKGTRLHFWLANSRSLAEQERYLAPTDRREAYERRSLDAGEVLEPFYGRSADCPAGLINSPTTVGVALAKGIGKGSSASTDGDGPSVVTTVAVMCTSGLAYSGWQVFRLRRKPFKVWSLPAESLSS